jgi:hypothetical protein
MFVEFFENHGIFDEFSAEQNRMITSQGVKNLYEIAKGLIPERFNEETIAEGIPAKMMRDLSEEERLHLIGNDDEDVVVDMRDYFAEEMARNGGARGLLLQLHDAQVAGDKEKINELWKKVDLFYDKEI